MESTIFHSFVHETDEATVADFSVFGEFLPIGGKQLAVFSGKVIRFYRFNPYALVPSHRVLKQSGSWIQKTRLECMYTMKLLQPVQSVAVVRYPDQELDSLAMAFDEARVSVISIHQPTMTMRTIHLHSIEEEFLRTGHSTQIYPPIVAVDTDNRCSVLLGYDQYVAVMPHVGSDLTPFSFELKEVDCRIENVLDVCFLHDFDQPTMLVLFEPHQATVGRATLRQDTVCLVAISLNLIDRSYAAVWTLNGLPMDLTKLVAIPKPVGGVVVIGENCAIYLSQSAPHVGISLNVFNKDFTKFPLLDRTEYQLCLTVVRAVVIAPNELLLVDGRGQSFLLTLVTDLNNAVHDLKVSKINAELSVPRTLTVAWEGYVFLGSRLGDSSLLHYSKHADEDVKTETAVDLQEHHEGEEEDDFLYDSVQPNKRKSASEVNSSASKRAKKVADTKVPFAVKSELFSDEEEKMPAEESANEESKEKPKESEDEGEKGSETGPVDSSEEQVRPKLELEDAAYDLVIVDNLENVGPVKFAMPALPDLHPVYQSKRRIDPIYDVIGACGHGKTASLNFFHRSVRPVANISCSMDGVLQVFTVGRQDDDSHTFLLAARETSTLVLEVTAGDLLEIAYPIFNTAETTIAAGDLYDGAIAVQVTPSGFTLVADMKTVESVNLNTNFPVVSASIVDYYIAMMTQNGRLLLYRVDLLGANVKTEVVDTKGLLFKEDVPITALCLYRDVSGLPATMCKRGNASAVYETTDEDLPPVPSTSTAQEVSADDEEDEFEKLYAATEEEPTVQTPAQTTRDRIKRQVLKDENLPAGAFVQNPDKVKTNILLFITSETSNLQIYWLPDMRLVFNSQRLSNHPNVLKHKNSARNTYEDAVIGNDYAEMRETQGGRPEDSVVEMLVLGMGYNQARPVLCILIDDMLVLYEMFHHDDHIEGSIAIRFRKLHNTVITRTSKYANSDGKLPVESVRGFERYRSKIVPFELVGDMTHGFFVAGGYPTWFFMQRGEMRQHPMNIDGPIHAFSAFNSSTCPYGFVYQNQKLSQIRLCCLQEKVDHDMSYPVYRVPMGESVHRIQYILQSDVLVIVTSKSQPTDKYCVLLNDEKVIETVKREIYPEVERFSVKLFSFEDYQVIPNSEIEMDEFEAVTACEEVLLSSESTITGLKNYVAIGTSASYGEEVVVRGRVILYEVIEVVPEPGFPTSKNKLKLIYDKEQKGAVASICSCDGYLLTGVGPKVFIWQFRDNSLHGISFLDFSYCVHQLTSYHNLALALDAKRSVSLIRYQEKFKALSLASRDHRTDTPPPLTAQFIFNNRTTGIIMTDESGALSIFTYSPHLLESNGGENLILNAYIQLGTQINSLIRAKPHVTDPMIDNPKDQIKIEKVDFATLDGSFGAVKPITEKMGRRLYYLQTEIISKLGSPAGLNGRTARGITVSKLQGNISATIGNNVADGRLCMEFLTLSQTEKNDIARGVGCSKYNLLDDLTELQRLLTHY